jgi:hypothetical protein
MERRLSKHATAARDLLREPILRRSRCQCLISRAGSDGRCNTCMKFTRWSLKI